jgi:hypothetical protein
MCCYGKQVSPVLAGFSGFILMAVTAVIWKSGKSTAFVQLLFDQLILHSD